MSERTMPEPPNMPLDCAVSCEIKLTPEQQRIVKEKTGRDMTELILDDEDGTMTHRMQSSSPEDFTILAIRQAERLNDYDEEYQAYLEELAAWQKAQTEPDILDDAEETASLAAQQMAERLRLFFEKETEACQNAREAAKLAWGKKDKTEA